MIVFNILLIMFFQTADPSGSFFLDFLKEKAPWLIPTFAVSIYFIRDSIKQRDKAITNYDNIVKQVINMLPENAAILEKLTSVISRDSEISKAMLPEIVSAIDVRLAHIKELLYSIQKNSK